MHNRALSLSKFTILGITTPLLLWSGIALAQYPKVFAYQVINKTQQDVWVYQPLDWLSCGVSVQANTVIAKLPRNGGRLTRNVFLSERGFFGRCANQHLSVKFGLLSAAKPTSSILAVASVYSTAPNPYGASYSVVCDKLVFSGPSAHVPYNVQRIGEESNFCQYTLGVSQKPNQDAPSPTNADDSN